MNPLSSVSRVLSGKRLIVVLSLFTVICGFASVFVPPVKEGLPSNMTMSYYYNALVSPFSPLLYGMGTISRMQYVNLFFYVLILVGCGVFIANGMEVRLIEFGAAVLLFNRVLGVCSLVSVGFGLMGRDYLPHEVGKMVSFVYIAPLVWLMVSILLLWATRRLRQLDVRSVPGESGQEALEYVHSSKGARFANYLIDLVLSVVFMIGAGPIFGLKIWDQMVWVFGERSCLILYLIVIRIFYYLFFEGIWGVTPGKFLTGGRVTDFYGGRIGFGKVLSRTFSRLVPFEAFSFLGSGDGWHDQWSQTYVLKEGRG